MAEGLIPSGTTGKTAVVTGASSGLGVTFADALATNGANIVLAARREDRLKEVQAGLPPGTKSIVTPCDITQPDQIEAMCEAAMGEFGAIDVFVANAGVVAEGVPAVEKTPPALFAAGIEVNVTGTFNCLTAAARRMLPAGKGSIIINASDRRNLRAPRLLSGVLRREGGPDPDGQALGGDLGRPGRAGQRDRPRVVPERDDRWLPGDSRVA